MAKPTIKTQTCPLAGLADLLARMPAKRSC